MVRVSEFRREGWRFESRWLPFWASKRVSQSLGVPKPIHIQILHVDCSPSMCEKSIFSELEKLFSCKASVFFTFKICKVAAHQEVTPQHTDLEVYDILGNRMVDEEAVGTCKHIQLQLVAMPNQMFVDLQKEKQCLADFFHFLIDLRKHFAVLKTNNREMLLHENIQAPTPLGRLANWTVLEVWSPPQPENCYFQYSVWGQVICNLQSCVNIDEPGALGSQHWQSTRWSRC